MGASVRHAEGNSALGVALSGLIDRGVSDLSAQRTSTCLRVSMCPQQIGGIAMRSEVWLT
jgi:hypothetical protein